MVNLVGYKATVVIFDLNGEYTSLGMSNDGKRNMYYDKIHTLTPGQNFKVALDQLHLNTVMGILVNALHLPGTSAREFRRIWKMLKEKGKLNMQELGEADSQFKLQPTRARRLGFPFPFPCQLGLLHRLSRRSNTAR